MKKFKIVPLPAETAARIRSARKDDFGNEVAEQVATGFGPCRLSLKPFSPGADRRLLFSYAPFERKGLYYERGPVYISKDEVEPYSDINRFPPEIKADKINFPLSLIGYNSEQKMIFTKLVGEEDVDLLIPKIFEEQAEVEYLHARNAEACCFICKIERV